MVLPETALKELQKGNRRFVLGESTVELCCYGDRTSNNDAGQHPIAVVIGCSDSRVPVEMLFDQGLGQLFVVRVAGNVLERSQIGSVEYGIDSLGASLIVVLGHSDCGAVSASLEDLEHPDVDHGENLGFLVDYLRPTMAKLLHENQTLSKQQLARLAVRANILASVAELKRRTPKITERLACGRIRIVGAEFSLETGEVEFIDL